MPCRESCLLCAEKIKAVCHADACGEECQAYICCTAEWSDHSGCEDSMFPAIAQLADDVTTRCGTVWTCDAPDMSCSESAEICLASGSFGRQLEVVERGSCPVVRVHGASAFDTTYTLVGSLDHELVFKAVGSTECSFVLHSFIINVCDDTDEPLLLGSEATDTFIIRRSASGRLDYDDDPTQADTGHEPNRTGSYWGNGRQGSRHAELGSARRAQTVSKISGAACKRHVWSLEDTTGRVSYRFVTVDPCRHPRYIKAEWVKIDPDGEASPSNVEVSCFDAFAEELSPWTP